MLSYIFNFIFALITYTLFLRTLKGNIRNLHRHQIKNIRRQPKQVTLMPTTDTAENITILPPNVPNSHYYEYIQNHLRRQELVAVKVFHEYQVVLTQQKNRSETLTNQGATLCLTHYALVDFLLYRSHKPLIHIPGCGLFRLYTWTFLNGDYIHYIYQEDLKLICIVFTRPKTPHKPLADVL